MSIKVKVNLPFDVHRALENDMKSFEFVKKDGNINKNKFVNHLLKNYYQTFSLQEDTLMKKIKSILKKDTDSKTSLQLIKLLQQNDYEDKYYNDYDLQFIINKENEKNFKIIEKQYLFNRSISQYFREMFISYASYKQDKREVLLFKDIATKINEAIANKKRILIYGSNEILEFEPYALDQTKEELYNYLLGILVDKNNKRQILSRKLYKIDEVIILNEDVTFSDEEEILLTKTMKYGAQFPINQIGEIKLELTKRGEQFYNKFYLNRPPYIEKNNNVYTFDCSFSQLEFYFFKFGEDVKILSPENLKNRFSKKYYDALQRYQKKKMH